MALNRLVFGCAIAVYFTVSGTSKALAVTLSSYMAFACLLFAWHCLRPGRAARLTLVCALVADLGVISLGMHLDGAGDAAMFPLYLWVIQGNGFRFGLRPLLAATALSFAGFAAVIVTTPYWRQQPALSAGLLAALVVLPIYSSALIRRLSRARLQAEAASRSKSMFLAAISHELRTPLNAILGSVSLIEDTPLDEEQRDLFASLRTGAQALLSLIGSVLDFSRVEAGSMPVACEPVDLDGLLIEVRDLVGVQARLKSLRLSVHVGSDVPSHILGDRVHLLEVLLNLAANAIKFTESGGVGIAVETIQAAAAAEGGIVSPPFLRFEVSDTGIGIAEEAHGLIFDVFSQADTSILDRFGGTGLGLAISRQLVTLMGGGIGVASRLGSGSTFWFTVPLAPAALPAPAETACGRAALLCDDDGVALQVQAALQARGVAVRRVASLQGVAGLPTRSHQEALFLYRRDPAGELAGDCALLGRLDPRGTVPRILLCASGAAVPTMMLERHFMMMLTLPADGASWSRALRLAGTALPERGGRDGDQADAAPSAPRPARAPPPPDRKRRAGRSLTVLVADDNEINRRVIGKILERSGHRALMAANGLQALDMMESRPLDLVLMDVNMPEMNGLEATRMFRLGAAPTPHLPILALTADATEQTERRCTDAGMDGCITKPVMPALLVDTVESMVAPAQPDGVTLITEHPRFLRKLPVLDFEVLAELRTLGGDGFVAELLHSFIADASSLIDRIEAAGASRNMTDLRFELHALCSGAANIGAASIRDAAGGRDITADNIDSMRVALVHRLRQELSHLEREWRLTGTQSGTSSA